MDQDESACVADDRLLIVGSGASAGGVEALGQLFNAMPEDLEAACVGVTHLGPLLAEIIARHASMQVENATHGQQLEANRIHLLRSLSKEIRELCIFSAHGVVRGPPRRDDRLRQRVESQVMEAFAT